MATTWGPGFVLKGKDGDVGPKGDVGPAGPQGESVTGPKGDPGTAGADGKDGAAGKDGVRGSQTYKGNGPPSNDLSSFSPPAMAGDTYYDLSGGPTLYFL